MKFNLFITTLLALGLVASIATADVDSDAAAAPKTKCRNRALRPTSTAGKAKTSSSLAAKATTAPPSKSTTAAAAKSTSLAAKPTSTTKPAGSTAAPVSSPTSTPAGSWWQPNINKTITWQIEISAVPSASSIGSVVKSDGLSVLDIDMFDTDPKVVLANDNVKPTAIAAYKAAGISKVICYFSAGTSEDWRPDMKNFTQAGYNLVGPAMGDWPGENWLNLKGFDPDNVTSPLANIMLARMKLAKKKGCDAVDPDNVDGYANVPDFVAKQDQINYNTWMTKQAHDLGLAVGLKNCAGLLPKLASSYDFSVVEQCNEYNECGSYSPMSDGKKPVFSIEYTTDTSVCKSMNTFNGNFALVKDKDLAAKSYDCRKMKQLFQ